MTQMTEIRRMAEEIVAREGGYVNDPDDPGGATKYGVTIHTLRRLGLDLDNNGKVDAEDVRRIPRDMATDIFLKHYFFGPRIGDLPPLLHATVFDMYVNAGSNAVKVLQRLLNDMGEDVAVDGAIGPQTAAACHRAAVRAPDHIVDAYGIARRNYYFSIADRRPASRKYARTRSGAKGGWIQRAEEFISERYHMSEAEFRARVASWA